MTTLTLVAEPFPDWEAPVQAAAARALADALAETAPRGCSVRVLVARDSEAPVFDSPRIAVEQVPMPLGSLPFLWQATATARPLDGEMTHAVSPMMPLRSRREDGSQATITVPHGLAWESPELLTATQARLTRSFVKRAVKHADVIVTGSHATAALLQQHYGDDLAVRVITPAAPTPFLAGDDAAARREALELPEQYLVTTANDDAYGRLEWAFEALRTDPSLPHLVVITGLDPAPQTKASRGAASAGAGSPEPAERIPEELRGRVAVVPSTDLSDVGAVLSGARMLVQPQSFAASGYAVIAALTAEVPVLHAGVDATAELAFDGGLGEPERLGFVSALSRLFIASVGDGTSELEQLAVHASDRGRAFSWSSAAWQLWEAHASI